jgi:hypothetical protein
MKWIDKIFGPEMEGKKTEYLALATSLVGAIIVGLNVFAGIELGPDLIDIITNVVAIGFALTLGARMTRTDNTANRIEMNQPDGPVQPVQPAQPVATEGDTA